MKANVSASVIWQVNVKLRNKTIFRDELNSVLVSAVHGEQNEVL